MAKGGLRLVLRPITVGLNRLVTGGIFSLSLKL